MPSVEQLRSRLLKKLSELFQLDQPDLDFGFYRIMHAKEREVRDFINKDLLQIVSDAFGDADEARKAELQAAYAKAVQTAKDFGAPDPEETEPVKKAKAALDAIKTTASSEAEVYDHLYRFFERYYEDGDFISRRYYTRETPGKAAPFAIPYNGEEVKLYWANADQYYIKTTEYFSNFSFDLLQAKEICRLNAGERLAYQIPEQGTRKVHFRIVEATEGEPGNVKASEANKRFFILHADNPVALTETGELVVNFEYRPDPEKTGQEGSWRDKRNAEAASAILERLRGMAAAGGEDARRALEYMRLLQVPAPTDSEKDRPVLAKYVNQYTARNTMDYFIHKDLGGFLHRELDFYIKNEVMRLDDIENADAPAVESYLAKIKVLRTIAGKLIDFLAQLENFQKKLWLKKKFVIETNYCLTLDRVPETLYAEVAANDAQCEEWVKLFAIDAIQTDLVNPGFSRPLTVGFLKTNDKLVLDTRFFDESFKARLLASIEDFDAQCDGLLVHSENFQALHLLQERYREQVKCVYIDPPYNTGGDGFVYKDSYQHSSWMTLLENRIAVARELMSSEAGCACNLNDIEDWRMRGLVYSLFDSSSYITTITTKCSTTSSFRTVNLGPVDITDRIIIFAKNRSKYSYTPQAIPKSVDLQHFSRFILNPQDQPNDWKFKSIRLEILNTMGFDCDTTQKGMALARDKWGEAAQSIVNNAAEKFAIDNADRIFETKTLQKPAKWLKPIIKKSCDNKNTVFIADRVDANPIILLGGRQFYFLGSGLCYVEGKKVVTEPASTLWTDIDTNNLKHEGDMDFPSGKKPLKLVRRLIMMEDNAVGDYILDYFAGSGTTGEAVIDLNRKDDGKRKYILVEMADYFDTVLKPRIAKVVYASDWKDGKPTARNTGISHCFKYIRLESYEDTLNNLRLDPNPQRAKVIAANPALREDYTLRYMLDVETRGSQSLLNIDAFADPTAYTLDVKKPGTDEYVTRTVDLIETFNFLIGLRVLHTSAPQTFQATFTRIPDPELPEDQHTKLVVDGRIRQDEGGPWWFRKVEGWVPADPAHPDNGQREKVLIVWRKQTSDIEQDNLMLDEWFRKNRISTRDFEFDTIYVNGSNNLPNLKLEDEHWKVRLIEEEFMKRMWNGENA